MFSPVCFELARRWSYAVFLMFQGLMLMPMMLRDMPPTPADMMRHDYFRHAFRHYFLLSAMRVRRFLIFSRRLLFALPLMLLFSRFRLFSDMLPLIFI